MSRDDFIVCPARRLVAKSHPDFSEKWLQERICEDPSLPGLGQLELIAAEKVLPRVGRLDLLLQDDQLNWRYEIERMLGPSDPSHIIRCIEYWDVERHRYPAYDHVAVLVAENITSRFLNMTALLAGRIPLIGLQMNALRVEDKIMLHFTLYNSAMDSVYIEPTIVGHIAGRVHSDPFVAARQQITRDWWRNEAPGYEVFDDDS